MSPNRLVFTLLLLSSIADFQLLAQQTETDQTVEEIKAKAESGDADSEFELAVHYANADGVPRDLAEAAKWYRKAADQNIAKAQFNLGLCYYHGQGVAKDLHEAVKWFRKAAE